MSSSAQFLNPSEAAKRLGVSVKALRLYEQRGLVSPTRTAAGWRVYGPNEMAVVGEIVALRDLGLVSARWRGCWAETRRSSGPLWPRTSRRSKAGSISSAISWGGCAVCGEGRGFPRCSTAIVDPRWYFGSRPVG